jgi:NAD(P)-dependent dehydrogenase (short-subunit alcohol dehydrogenase family)
MPEDAVQEGPWTVDTAVERFGRLDILVNNAGRGMKYVSDSFMAEPSRFWEISLETWRSTSPGAARPCAADFRPMVRQRLRLNRKVWSQLQGTGVTVNALLPGGATRTGMVPDSVSDVRSRNFDRTSSASCEISQSSGGTMMKSRAKRFVATKWRSDLPGREAAEAAAETASW